MTSHTFQKAPERDDSYTYLPLKHRDSIRILELKPARSENDDLEGDIVEHRLEDNPAFEAISYVWGEPVFCEDLHTSKGIVKITKSLAGALRRFRFIHKTRCLWADAICIDQTNDVEKGHQVGQMGLVYRTAEQVLAWLGEGSEDTRQAMLDCIRIYPEAEKYHVQEKDIDFEVFSGPNLKHLDSSGREVNMSTWSFKAKVEAEAIQVVLKSIRESKIEDLVALPWFSRLWVIQEVASSTITVLHCGNESLEWKVFASVMRLLVAIVTMQGPSLILGINPEAEILTENLKRAWNIVHLRTEHRAIAIGKGFAISLYRQFGGSLQKASLHVCTDDRDRIYGLISLMSSTTPGLGVNIQPDYSKSAVEIYRDFTVQYLTTKTYAPDARILYDAGLYKRTSESWDRSLQLGREDPRYLPSWVPEYRPQNQSQDELPWETHPFNTRWQTCPPLIYDHHENKNVLGISATIVDRIESLYVVLDTEIAPRYHSGELSTAWLASLDQNSHWSAVFACLQAAQDICTHLMKDGRYMTGEDFRAAIVRTLLAECSHSHVSRILFDYPKHTDEAEMIALWDLFQRCCLHPQGEVRRMYEGPPEDFAQRIADVNAQREAAATPEQRMKILILSDEVKTCLEFMSLVQWVLSRCKLIFSTTGMLALVPRAAQQYDVIVQISGTTMPYVVRPVADTGLCELVGPSYVHGIMHCPSFDHDLEISKKGGVIFLV